MDGLLIDSEDKYTIITNAILQEYGKPLLPWSIKAQLQGRPAPEVCDYPPYLLSPTTTGLVRRLTHSGQQDLPRVGQTPHLARGI